MGLYFSHYMVMGVDISRKKKEVMQEEKYLPYIEGHRDVDFRIIDGREREKFLFFGKVLARGDHYQGFKAKDSTIDISNLSIIQKQVAENYSEVFGEPCELSDVKLIAFTSIS